MPGVDIKASGSILEASSFSKLSFWNEKKKKAVDRNAFLSTRKCCLLVCFRLFWSDWETSGIHSVDKDTGGDMMTVAKGLDRPTAFVIFKATPPGL